MEEQVRLEKFFTAEKHQFFSLADVTAVTVHAALSVTFGVLIVLTNVFVCVVVGCSSHLRRSSKHLLIASLCLADLLMGAFVCTIMADAGFRRMWVSDCFLLVAFRMFLVSLVPGISTLAVLMLNVDYILRLQCFLYAKGLIKQVIVGTMLAFPWLISCAGLVLLFIFGLRLEKFQDVCMQSFPDPWMLRLTIILSFFPQGCLVLLTLFLVAAFYLHSRRNLGLDVCGERVRAPVDLCWASFITLIFYSPVFLLSAFQDYIGCTNAHECYVLAWLYHVSAWLLVAKSFVTPFAWLFCKDIREALEDMCCACCL